MGNEVKLLPTQDRQVDDLDANFMVDALSRNAGSERAVTPLSEPDGLIPVYVSSLDPRQPESASQSPPSSVPVNQERWISIFVELILENVSIELHLDPLDDDAAEKSSPLINFNLNNSKFIFKGFTNGTPLDAGSSLHVLSHKIIATDVRPRTIDKRNRFSEVLAPSALHQTTEETPQLEIRYNSDPSGAQLDVLLHRARLIIAPEFFDIVKTFLAATNSIEFSPSVTRQSSGARTPVTPTKSMSPSGRRSETDMARAVELNIHRPDVRPPNALRAKFGLYHAEFVVVENPLVKYSSAVVVGLNADLILNRKPGFYDFDSEISLAAGQAPHVMQVASSKLTELQIRVCLLSIDIHDIYICSYFTISGCYNVLVQAGSGRNKSPRDHRSVQNGL